MQIGTISSHDLELLLHLQPELFKELEEARESLIEISGRLFTTDTVSYSWCHLYELPAKNHFISVFEQLGLRYLLEDIATSPNQFQALPKVIEKFYHELNKKELDSNEAESLVRNLPSIFGLSLSVANSVRCLLIYGSYLNDLIAIVRNGSSQADAALFKAVKIDPTVLACPSVNSRVSKALMFQERTFLNKLHQAVNGKFTKREQANYQNMRLILQILHETNAPRLGEADLYQLFVEELDLVSRDRRGDTGDVGNNLRQFAYQFMKQKSVS